MTSMAFALALFFVSFLSLGYSGGLLVRSITNIARFLRFSEYTAAFLLMSAATSIPELFVGIAAANREVPALSFGNVIGANIVNVTLLIGLASLFGGGLAVESKISRRNFLLVSGLALLPILLGLDGVIARGDGVVLLVLFLFYLWSIAREREHFTASINHIRAHAVYMRTALRSFLFFGLGVVVLLASAATLVWSARVIVNTLAIGVFMFGALFVSLGTALPEIAFSLKAAMLKRRSMAVGNALGSMAFTATGVVGLVSVTHPIAIAHRGPLLASGGFLLVGLILFNLFVAHRTTISRREGALLVLVYVAYIGFLFSTYMLGLDI